MKRLMILMTIAFFTVSTAGISTGFDDTHGKEVYQAQTEIKKLGYDPGSIDGLWGEKTEKAIKKFQYDCGLPVTGRLDLQTKKRLGLMEPTQKAPTQVSLQPSTRGIRIVAVDNKSGRNEEIKLYDKTYAVIIGIDQYKNLPFDMQLSYAVRDAKGIEQVLRNNFKFDKIITLYNKDATKDQIMKVLLGDLTREVGEDDAVFVFWAGHGCTEKTAYGDLGYLIPFDGTSEASELYKNVSMSMLKDDISKKIPAKHVFYVMDACYSGLLAKTRGNARKSGRDYNYLKEITREKVRQVLTAGDKGQTVLDGGPNGHSVFTGRFIELLENADDFITATEMSTMVKEKVFSDARARNHTQTPRYGELFGVGDFVFIPSIEQKVEGTQAKVAGLQKELERLKATEMAALKAQDERARLRSEIEKGVILAKLKAEQLRQEMLAAEKQRRDREEAERLQKEREVAQKKKDADSRLASLKRTVAAKRKAMGDTALQSLSPGATIREMKEIDAKIKNIQKAYRDELANAVKMVCNQVNDKFEKAANAKKDEFESQADFKNRVDRMKQEAGQAQTKGFLAVSRKIEDAYNKEIAPFIEALKKLSGQEFTLLAQDLELELHKYEAKFNAYPVTIRAKKPCEGVMIACSANIPIPRDEARIFKQHFDNNILRPEISGNFQSTGFFRVAKAYVIDDATNQKYDMFASKFVDLGNGIVYDSVTKLLWLKDPYYIKEKLNWQDTKKTCKNLQIRELSGWRLPTRNELKRMYTVFHNLESHPFNEDMMHGYYWTNEERGTSSVWTVSIEKRDIDSRRKSAKSSSIWPVRGSE